MSNGLINEARKLARVAIPLVKNFDILGPQGSMLIDGTTGTNRIWKLHGNNCSFIGEKIDDPHDRICINISPDQIALESVYATPIHRRCFITTRKKDAQVATHLKTKELSVKSELRELRENLKLIHD
jgi:hypothetical protein